MTRLQIIALTSFILCYLFLFSIFFPNLILDTYPIIFPFLWPIGVINALSNLFYANKIKIKKWVLVIFGISSIVWISFPLSLAALSHPLFVVFLFIGVYVHLKPLFN